MLHPASRYLPNFVVSSYSVANPGRSTRARHIQAPRACRVRGRVACVRVVTWFVPARVSRGTWLHGLCPRACRVVHGLRACRMVTWSAISSGMTHIPHVV